MDRRSAVAVGAMCWAVVGASIGLGSLSEVDRDARLLVGVASIAFALCAAVAAILLRRSSDRLAGLLLVASAATPTYFAYVLNIPALIVGIVLVAAPALLFPSSAEALGPQPMCSSMAVRSCVVSMATPAGDFQIGVTADRASRQLSRLTDTAGREHGSVVVRGHGTLAWDSAGWNHAKTVVEARGSPGAHPPRRADSRISVARANAQNELLVPTGGGFSTTLQVNPAAELSWR